MIVFKYRVTGEREVRYLCMLGDNYAASIHDPVNIHHSMVVDEYTVGQLVEGMRAKMEDILMREMHVVTDYDKLAIRSQVRKPDDVSLFDVGEFINTQYAENIINEYRKDPLTLHEDGITENIFHV